MAKGKFQKPRTPIDQQDRTVKSHETFEFSLDQLADLDQPAEEPIKEFVMPAEEPVSDPYAETVVLPKEQLAAAAEQARPTLAQKAEARENGKKRPRWGLISAITGGAVVAAFVGILLWGVILQNGGNIFPNVHVAGVNVGGLTRDEAIAAVNEAAEAAYESYSLTVQLTDRNLTFTPEQTGIAVNADDAVEEAARYGRSSGPLACVGNWLLAHTRDSEIDLETSLLLDEDYIRDMIAQVAEDCRQDIEQPTADYDAEAGVLTLTLGKPKRELDTEGLFDAVVSAFMAHSEEPLVWKYDEIPCRNPELEEYIATYGTPVADAVYDEETRTISESVRGYGFDVEEVRALIAASEEGATLEIPFVYTEPAVSTEQLEEEMFGTVLHEVSSVYVVNANRTKNLELACAAINGTILNPGDTFSFNDIVGERTAEKGYKPATVYVTGGASDSQLGGGICQVASTMYYGTLHLMNVEQVQREPHMYAVTYVPMGMDAAIYWDMKQDYKFKNIGNHPMKIETWLEDGKVQVRYLGVKDWEETVKMTYQTLATYGWEEVEEVDETKEPGFKEVKTTPYTGYKIEAFRTVYDKDGKEISKTSLVSNYKKRDKVWTVGPAVEEEPDWWEDNPDVVLPDAEEDENDYIFDYWD